MKAIKWRKYFFRVLLAAFYVFVVCKIKDIGAAIAFFGCVFYTLMGFVAPILIYENNYKLKRARYEKYLNYSILIFGVIMGVIGAYKAVGQMFY